MSETPLLELSPEEIGGDRRRSEEIRGDQRQFGAIGGAKSLRGTQWHSMAMRGN
jgi:hypothetical protein